MDAPASIQALLDSVADNLPEHGDTYACPDCCDRGYVLFDRWTKYQCTASYGKPCPGCELGQRIRQREVLEAGQTETRREQARPERNKRLKPLGADVDPDNIPF